MRIPYALSVHGREEEKAVARVIREHRTGIGTETKTFEKKVAALFGKKYGVMVNSGSSANLLAFEILNLPPGSEVITPALTFSTTLSPILQKGLIPVFVDVRPHTFLADLDQIEKKINKRTGALMIPSLLGNVPDLVRLRKLANKHKLFLIEDSCDTLGARFKGRPTGTFSDVSTASFYGSHVINAAGGGGMVLVNRIDWYRRLIVLRGWGRSSELFAELSLDKRFAQKLAGVPYDGKFFFLEIGYNFLPLETCSAFGLAQLRRLPVFAGRRRRNFKELLGFFKRWKQFFDLPRQTSGSKTSWLAFPLTIRPGAPFSRLEIVKFLEKQNIQTRPVFSGDVLRQPAFRRLAENNLDKKYPAAEDVMKNSFLVGCHQGLMERHMAHLKKTFNDFLKKF